MAYPSGPRGPNGFLKRISHPRYAAFIAASSSTGFGHSSAATRGKIAANFARSEERAWNSATPLHTLLISLYNKYHTDSGESRVRLLAHSMGNVAASEALRLEAIQSSQPKKIVNTYVASQGATWSEAFDGSDGWAPPAVDNDPMIDNYHWYKEHGGPYFSKLYEAAEKLINYYNPVDYAVGLEMTMNDLFKPNGINEGLLIPIGANYNYIASHWFLSDYTQGYFALTSGKRLNRVADRYAIFSYSSVSTSIGVGRAVNLGGPFSTANQIDLQADFGFTNAPYDHEAQLMSTNANRWEYWSQLLTSYGLNPIQRPGFSPKPLV